MNFLAWVALDRLGWHYLVALTTAPLVLGVVGYRWLPESPRWLAAVGRGDEALETVRAAATANGTAGALAGVQSLTVTPMPEGDVGELLRKPYRPLTLLLWLIWIGFGFTYWLLILTADVRRLLSGFVRYAWLRLEPMG